MGFPNAEDVFSELLEPIAPVYTVTPSFVPDKDDDTDPEAIRPPLIGVFTQPGQVTRNGLYKSVLVEVSAFGLDRAGSIDLDTQIEAVLTGLHGFQTQAGYVDAVESASSASQYPYDNADTRRTLSVWRMVAKRQAL